MVDLHRQYLDIRDEVDRAIGDVIAETAFIKGPAVGLFEEELARRLEVRHCIACGNGTDALLLSLLAVGLQRGDEVIVPAFAFAAVTETVLLLGGVPVFADVDPRTFNIDPASVARLVSERTRVVIPVHLFGQPCDMAALTAVAKEHGLKVIEDNAQSLGAVCRMSDGASRYAGTIGEIGCTSFFPSKVLGCYGDGGAVFTDDDGLAARIRALGSHGWFPKYDSRLVGMNSRLDTLQAAVLAGQAAAPRHMDRRPPERGSALHGAFGRSDAGRDPGRDALRHPRLPPVHRQGASGLPRRTSGRTRQGGHTLHGLLSRNPVRTARIPRRLHLRSRDAPCRSAAGGGAVASDGQRTDRRRGGACDGCRMPLFCR